MKMWKKEEKAFDDELSDQLDEITARDERGAHQAEHVRAHYDYIRMVDKIQEIVDENDTDDEDESEDEED